MSDLNKMHYEMLRIRMIEEEIARRYPEGKMRCPVHLSVGQEAGAVGICAGLKPNDKMVSTHRSHAHYLAKGGSLKALIGELYGKVTGCARGNGGSMHLIDLSVNFYGSTSIVGGTIPIGVGIAFADKISGSDATTVICIGDAAVEEGVFHEAANFTALHKLKVIFAIENNHYSCYTYIHSRQPNRSSLKNIALAHDLVYVLCRPNDISSINDEAVFTVFGKYPTLIEIPTYRHLQHCGPENDDHLGYRPKGYMEYWRGLDPVKILDASWPAKIKQEIDEAFLDAENAPYPDPSEIGKYVYAHNNI